MSVLRINQLRAAIAGREVLQGIDLEIKSGEIHAIMGPNGAGKSSLSNVLMGNRAYEVLGGEVTLDGIDLLAIPTYQRAAAGLFLAPQSPIEIPGVPLRSLLREALIAQGRTAEAQDDELSTRLSGEASAIGVPLAMLERAVNVDASGGEKKRIETLQLAILQPLIALLDELDSGLDVDALRDVARRVERQAHSPEAGTAAIGVLAITHYRRLLDELHPDAVHIFVNGKIVKSGGLELADELEHDGYAAYVEDEPVTDFIFP
jgi:Fe-S cluster assembly ATP-binding protein